MKKPDVLIVGAGPVGLTLAIECCRHGVKPRIIDHHSSHSTQSKALAIWSGTLECFAAMGIVEEFLKVALPIRHLVFADHGKVLNSIPSHRGIDSAYPAPIILPQSHTEEILERHLATLGVSVERETELLSFSQNETTVTATILKKDKTQETLSTAFLAGCDGARSTIRHQLGLSFEGETESLGFVLIDAKVEGDLPENSVFINWGKNVTTAFFPVKKGVFRIFAQRKDCSDQSTPTLEEMQSYLTQSGLGHWRLYDPEWLSYFGVNERVVSRNRVDRIFLLGDAAHIHSPAGGQGMNTGIQDAFNLGWKLGLLTKKVRNSELIAESYVEERHPIAQNLVRETTKMLHTGVKHSLLARIAKDIAVTLLLHLPALQQMLTEKLSEMNIHYPSSKLIVHDALSTDKRAYQSGWRIYDAPLIEQTTQKNTSLFQQLLHPEHTLLIFSGMHLSEEMSLLLERLVADEMIVKIRAKPLVIWHRDVQQNEAMKCPTFLDPTGEAHHHFGITSPSWILVRPDLYVAARGALEEEDRLDIYCERIA